MTRSPTATTIDDAPATSPAKSSPVAIATSPAATPASAAWATDGSDGAGGGVAGGALVVMELRA